MTRCWALKLMLQAGSVGAFYRPAGVNDMTTALSNFRRLALFLLTVSILSLAGCGGTKVYTADKTMVHQGNLYNMASVKRVGSRVEGKSPDGDAINMRGLNKKEVESLLKANDSIMVTTIVELDDQDMVYERRNIGKYSEYSSMMKRFDRALKDITKFMGDKKKTQLKLS
jgi:hypothetical protein